jgi:signal transduction histidine kinase
MLTVMGRAAYGFGQAMTDVTNEEQRLREQLAAEREARHEAERLAAENARLLYDRQDELELLEMVAAASNEATAIEPALGAAIVHVCAHMRWPVGHAYLVDPATGALRPSGVWYLEDEERYAAFREVSEQPGLVPWLPSRVLRTGESAWVSDVDEVTDLIGASGLHRVRVGQEAGLRAGFAFPMLIGNQPAGVLEFFTGGQAVADPGLLHIMDQIGVQLGRVVERERARAELERSNADLEAFAYVASHDLAEPLRSVAGFVALLERQYGDRLDDQAREFIAYAVDGVERMQRMIDDLLLYARAGTTDLRLERVDAGELVAGALRDLGTAVAERGATIEVGALPVLRADAGQLQRVFLNLLGNAIKYTAPDVAPHVTVCDRSAGDDAEIAVADNGIGIDPAQVERAFEMFARLPGRAAQYQGTGLGLAISRRIVERHGGRLWVEPNAGGGSVFALRLPLP